MRVLVTGVAGFAGQYLVQELTNHAHEVWGLDQAEPRPPFPRLTSFHVADIRNPEPLRDLLRKAAPDACVHLAAVASVLACEADPHTAWAVNVTGTLNLLEALRREAPTARVLTVSSAHVYGPGSSAVPIVETPFSNPTTFYGCTKLAADLLALHYARAQGLRVCVARPANHIGPGQSADYAIAAFAEKISAIARREAHPVLQVGNLESTRAFLDVRDTVRGYRLLLEKGRPGRIYHVAGGQAVSMGDALARLSRVAGVQPRIEIDRTLFRPTDHSPRLDTSRITDETGWTPVYTLDRTLEDIQRHFLEKPRLSS